MSAELRKTLKQILKSGCAGAVIFTLLLLICAACMPRYPILIEKSRAFALICLLAGTGAGAFICAKGESRRVLLRCLLANILILLELIIVNAAGKHEITPGAMGTTAAVYLIGSFAGTLMRVKRKGRARKTRKYRK